MSSPPMDVSVVIPNWNGERYLSRCVAAALVSTRQSGLNCEVVVVDDASTDASAHRVEEHFPQVRVLRNSANKGFGATVVRGAREVTGTTIVLLNNDLVVDEKAITELTSPLRERPEVFGVTGKAIDWDGVSPNHLNMNARWRNGELHLGYSNPTQPSPTMFLLGGFCAMRREEFLRLGGYSELFKPGYWEDYDLSYLALKAGWELIYNPDATAHHFGQGSMKQAYGDHELQIIRARNEFLFCWVNLTDCDALRKHTGTLPRVASQAGASRSAASRIKLRGLLQALRMVPKVVQERQRRAGLLRITDRQIRDALSRE